MERLYILSSNDFFSVLNDTYGTLLCSWVSGALGSHPYNVLGTSGKPTHVQSLSIHPKTGLALRFTFRFYSGLAKAEVRAEDRYASSDTDDIHVTCYNKTADAFIQLLIDAHLNQCEQHPPETLLHIYLPPLDASIKIDTRWSRVHLDFLGKSKEL